MKIPKKLRMFGRTFRIDHSDYKCHEFCADGYINVATQEICLKERADSYTEEHEADTLMHEIIHAIIKYNYIDIGAGEDSDEEERLVSCLATSIVQIIRDNKLDFIDRT